MNYAQAIVEHLGGNWFESRGFGLAPGPGHKNQKRDRSLKISTHRSDPDDVVVHSYAGDDVLELKKIWRQEGLLPPRGGTGRTRDPAKVAIQQKREADETERTQEVVRWLWSKSQPAGAIVKTYLKSRGIELARRPRAIRFLPANPPKHPYPAMIVPFGLPDEPEPGVYVISPERIKGLHLTYLQSDGSGKAPVDPQRRIIGCPKNAPLALIPPNDGLSLVIGEGIETTLSGALPNGLGAWAAGSAPFLPFLADPVPAFIKTVWIMREQDPAGQHGANELGRRLEARNIEVFMVDVE